MIMIMIILKICPTFVEFMILLLIMFCLFCFAFQKRTPGGRQKEAEQTHDLVRKDSLLSSG